MVLGKARVGGKSWGFLLGLAILMALSAAAGGWMLSAPRPAFTAADEPRFAGGNAEHGRLVFEAGVCSSCHASPGQSDRLRLGGGLALGTTRGVFRPPNISPHPIDGIGSWSAVDFANAMMSGVSPGGEHYYPAFPYTSYSHATVADVRDLFAFLRTLTPVAGRPPDHDLPLPLRIRRGIGLWKLVYFKPGATDPTPREATDKERGRYLVSSLVHCAECHSARNIAWAIKESTRFAGGVNPEGVGWAPNITPDGIGAWSEDDVVRMLTTGETPTLRSVGNTMADVVTSTALLPESDRKAIAAYIKSLPARPDPSP